MEKAQVFISGFIRNVNRMHSGVMVNVQEDLLRLARLWLKFFLSEGTLYY